MTSADRPAGSGVPVPPGSPGSPEPGAGGCPRKPDAAPYLLGALSPSERTDYSAHLDTCSECLHEVGQLAGLPGLLAHAPTGTVPAGDRDAVAWETPPDLVPGAVAALRRYRARRRTLAAASVVVVAGAILGAGVLFGRSTGPTGPQAVALPVQMQQVSAQPVTANVGTTERAWGTAINLRCRLDASATPTPTVFVLVAVSEDGSTQELARWQAHPDEDANIATATELLPGQLRALEVKAEPAGVSGGSTVLRTEQV